MEHFFDTFKSYVNSLVEEYAQDVDFEGRAKKAVELALENANIDSEIEQAAEDYDFTSYLEEAAEEFDWEKYIEKMNRNGAVTNLVKKAVSDYMDQYGFYLINKIIDNRKVELNWFGKLLRYLTTK